MPESTKTLTDPITPTGVVQPTAPAEALPPAVEHAFAVLEYFLLVNDEEQAAEDRRPVTIYVEDRNTLATRLVGLVWDVAGNWPDACAPALLLAMLECIDCVIEENADAFDVADKEGLLARVNELAANSARALGDDSDDEA